MKILYVITKSNWGGAQRHVYDLASAMKNKGHDVWVALGGEGILKQKLEGAGIYTYSISALGRDISLSSDMSALKEIISIIKLKRPDVLHLHSPKAAGLGALAGRIMRVKKIITTVHGWTFNENRPFHARTAIMFFSWLTMVLCHKTILLSEKEYSQALHFPFIKNKIKLIPLGIKSIQFISIDGAKQSIAKIIGLDVGEFNRKTVIGTVAELHPNKALENVIDAMPMVVSSDPNAICVIIGTGECRDKLQNLIRERKMEKNVYLIGYLDNASEYLKAFSIFVLSSIKEGLPYCILEAGIASLPIVATTVGGIPEIIDDMKSGILIQPKNSRELAHALSFMIEHPEERKKYGASLKEKIITKFSHDKMVWMVDGLYAEMRK